MNRESAISTLRSYLQETAVDDEDAARYETDVAVVEYALEVGYPEDEDGESEIDDAIAFLNDAAV